MPFIKLHGFPAKVYIPEEESEKNKKHNCKDCFACQWCSDERCEACLKSHCANIVNNIEDSSCKIKNK